MLIVLFILVTTLLGLVHFFCLTFPSVGLIKFSLLKKKKETTGQHHSCVREYLTLVYYRKIL